MFIGILIALTSAVSRQDNTLRKGMKAPVLTSESSVKMDLEDLRGQYVVLSFWSSTDPDSRIKAREMESAAKQSGITSVNVNFDSDERLYNELMSIEGLSSERSIHAVGNLAEDIVSAYGLSSGYATYLIDPSGRIAAINPETSSIVSLTKNLSI